MKQKDETIPVSFIKAFMESLEETEKWHDVAVIKRLGIWQMLEKWKEYNESNISN